MHISITSHPNKVESRFKCHQTIIMTKSSSKRAAVVGAAAFLAAASSASAHGLRGSRSESEKGSGAEEVVVSSVYLSNARPSEEATEKVIAKGAPFSITSYNESTLENQKRKMEETTVDAKEMVEAEETKRKPKKKKKKDPNPPSLPRRRKTQFLSR